MTCQYHSDNHSTDKVAVYYGEATPLDLCGYHARWKLNLVLKGLTK
jgi:hypothetical protein